jgi:hypothetical protein
MELSAAKGVDVCMGLAIPIKHTATHTFKDNKKGRKKAVAEF